MKLKTHHDHASTMTGETSQFSIAVNGKAFSILLDGLYSHKERAVIRELWTNAFDSHVDAGIPSVPFDVSMPGRLDPTFRVRDYGVSLTHEQVMGLYTTLFDSTKDDSNDVVGALGLGSKSPFAYTDSFTVIARLDGRKRTYLASIGPDGTPGITLLGDVESDEAQGLEVSIVVNPNDFRTFEQEARAIAIGFDPTPNVDGIEIEVPEPSVVLDDGSAVVYPSGVLPWATTLNIRQGCVIYPVEDRTLGHPIANLFGYGAVCIIDVPIGEVSIAASRESLSLDPDTRDNITVAVTEFRDKLEAQLNKDVDALPSMKHATMFVYGNASGPNNRRSVVPGHKWKWRGTPVESFLRNELKDWDEPSLKVRSSKTIAPLTVNRNGHTQGGIPAQNVKGIKIVVRRTEDKVVRAMRRYAEYVKGTSRYDSVYLLTDPTDDDIKNFKSQYMMTDDNFIEIADLPDPGAAQRAANTGPKEVTGVYQLNPSRIGGAAFTRVTDLNGIDYFWIKVDKRPGQWEASKAKDLTQLLSAAGLTGEVFLFTESAVKREEPEADKEADKALDAHLSKNKEAILNGVIEERMNANLDGLYRIKKLVLPGMNLPHRKNMLASGLHAWVAGNGPWWGHSVWVPSLKKYEEEIKQAGKKGKDLANEIKGKFPLLWGAADDTHVEAYVKWVQAGSPT
jgi:hypothetical protein